MSVLIRDMEMPTNCMLCPLCVEEADPANGEMCMVTGTLMPPCTRERLDNCPLVPVQPHGRLIDASAIWNLLYDYADSIGMPDMMRFDKIMEAAFSNAPTIIEAEEGE